MFDITEEDIEDTAAHIEDFTPSLLPMKMIAIKVDQSNVIRYLIVN